MKRSCVSVLAALAIAGVLPSDAAAQTAAPASSSLFAGRLSIGAIVGAAAVQNVGGSFGGEISYTVTDAIDIFGEGAMFQDVVTRRRLDRVPTITNFLQSSQGKTATGTLTAPAGYGGGGVRVTLMQGRSLRPYVAFAAGSARIALTPAFTLGGTDVTASLSQYGIALGSDLTGDISAAAFGGGGGVRINKPRFYIDGGVRLTSIRTPDQPTNVLRGELRAGLRF